MGIIIDNFKLKGLEILKLYGFSYKKETDIWTYTFITSIYTGSPPSMKDSAVKIIISNNGESIEFRSVHGNYFIVSGLPIQPIEEGNYQKYIKAVDTFVENSIASYRYSCFAVNSPYITF